MSQNLTTCPDCNKEISKKAESCPHCGTILKKRQSATGIAAAIVIGIVLYLILSRYHFFGW
jgi:uncharacterized paraquat-inducible protein A